MGLLSAIGMAGDVAGGLLQRDWSKRDAQRQMDFQNTMSSTAHQREVKDLEAAGLNPLLSANSGASSPAGSMAQAMNIGEGMAGSMRDAQAIKLQAQKQSSEIKNIDQDTENKKDSSDLIKAQIRKAETENRVMSWDAAKNSTKAHFFTKFFDKLMENIDASPKLDGKKEKPSSLYKTQDGQKIIPSHKY